MQNLRGYKEMRTSNTKISYAEVFVAKMEEGTNKPDGAPEEKGQNRAKKALQQQIVEYVSAHLAEDLRVCDLCRRFAVSRAELYRIMRYQAPGGVAHCVRQLRFERACDLLHNTSKPLWQIAAEVGYDNPDYFLRAFKKEMGCSVGEYRRQFRDAQCD